MTADDSTKSQCAHSGMKGQVGGFQNPGVCLQAFPSFLPSPPPPPPPSFTRSIFLRLCVAIKRVGNLVSRGTLTMIYKALIQPYSHPAILSSNHTVWGSIGVCHSKWLQKLQNKDARFITFSDLNIRTSTLLGDLGWDSLERKRSKPLAIILFKALQNPSLTSLNIIFKSASHIQCSLT